MPTIERSAHSRLPAVEEPSRGKQLLTGAVALLGTFAIVIGVPIALLSAFGAPWPDETPSVEWLSSPTTGETVLAVLAVVVWLAWAHFVVCLVVEAVAERRKSGLAPHVPGGGIGTQTLARRLVASIVLLAATTSIGMSSASAVESAAPAAGSQFASQTMQAPVAQADAEPAARDGVLPAADTLERATSVDLAEGVTTYYDVKPPHGRHYDTLWDIAERYLGDGLRYKEVWDLNKGVTQPDGRVLEKADLIHPGWVMKLPNDAKGPGLKVVDHAVDSRDETPTQTSTASTVADTQADAADQASAEAAGGGIEISDRWAPLFGVAGGLVLAGAFLGLKRRRASAPSSSWWAMRGPSAPDPHDPDPTTPSPGTHLRDETDTATAGWVDRAVRSLNGSRGMPAPLRASVSDGGLALVFEESPEVEPPAGWSRRGRVWTIDRDTEVPAPGLSPLPGLASIGRRDDGSILLIDPESVGGVLSLDGDSATARGLALSMAIDTATHPWADGRAVTLVGFAGDVSGIGQGSIRRSDDIERVLEGLDNVARYQRNACQEAGASTVRAARALAPQVDWTYHLVVCSGLPTADEFARLRVLAADPQVALGVIVLGGVRDAALRLTARPDGRISSPMHSIEVTAQVLRSAAADALAQLYDSAEHSRRVTLDQLVETLEAEQQHVAAAHEPVARVRVLGPVVVEAAGTVEREREEFLTELACFLALHPGGVHANRISAALWPRGVDDEVRNTALAQVATWFGTTEDGAPVLEEESGIWRFAPGAVELDWASFRDALNRAAEDGARREVHMRSALDLVSGLPFADVPPHRYAWLESMTLEGDIAMAVSLTVQACAEAAAARDDERAARAALAQGLTMLPANEELWRSRIRLAAHFGDRDALETVVDQMYAAIAEHGSVMGASAETDGLVDELLPGHRTRRLDTAV